jgi:cytochrome c oxidase subunit 3
MKRAIVTKEPTVTAEPTGTFVARKPGWGVNGNGHRNGGFRGNGGGGGGRDRDDAAHDGQPIRYKLGLLFGLVAITMTFGALTGAFVLRLMNNHDWHSIRMPRLLWLSTALIVASSVTMEAARRALRHRAIRPYYHRLLLTLGLGLGFLIAQLMAWRSLVARGIYLASNPLSSFFYIITGAHGLHLMGGIVALGYLVACARSLEIEAMMERRTISEGVAIYWHFMDLLWLGLFALLSSLG